MRVAVVPVNSRAALLQHHTTWEDFMDSLNFSTILFELPLNALFVEGWRQLSFAFVVRERACVCLGLLNVIGEAAVEAMNKASTSDSPTPRTNRQSPSRELWHFYYYYATPVLGEPAHSDRYTLRRQACGRSAVFIMAFLDCCTAGRFEFVAVIHDEG